MADRAPPVIPIIGQECICPDGLGRVIAFRLSDPVGNYVQVQTYVLNRGCKWAPGNVRLLPLPEGTFCA